ncbi:unnamed protein product [Diamesa hyperborea]
MPISNIVKRSTKDNVKCVEDGRFYRNPDRELHKIWTTSECNKYYLCLDGNVFEFKCSIGLLFDVVRQICDFKQNVDNCDTTAEEKVPKPLLEKAQCPDDNLGCADGTCLPNEYFCDGSVDCPDASDEGYCNVNDDPNAVDTCDPANCALPDCFCSKDGTQIPGGLNPSETPQMIMLTFDDSVNFDNWELYQNKLFTSDRINPNDCPIRATFFVSHQFTDYQKVQKLWQDGHEIAIHSITHRGPEEWWSKNATIEDYFDEFVGQANIINKFGNVRMEELRGMRVPFLKPGWNRQFLMMREFGFIYDSTIVAPASNIPLWPYTLDYKMPHECVGSNHCPSRSYPGVWEMVLNQLEADEYTCVMIDSCPPNMSGDDIYHMFMHNFKRHYNSNRAPLGLYFHSTWFKRPEYLEAFSKFMDYMQTLPDVYFTTQYNAVQWMKHPVPVDQMKTFEPWSCKPRQFEQNEITCNLPYSCKLHSRVLQQDRYLNTCQSCPPQYPWIRNEFGLD